MKGGIYISTHSGLTFSDDLMVNFILESNNLSEDIEDNILNSEENGIKSWYVSYTDSYKNLTCMLMYKRKDDKLWFVSGEVEPEYWKSGWEDKIVRIFTSFNIDSN